MSSSLSALLKRSDITDHEEVIKACNATLKQSRGDTQAAHVKAVALLKLDRFDDALRVFEEGGDALKKRGQLEYAYALYKAGDLEKARELARVVSSRGAQHLEAQASYRLEDFANVKSLYSRLAENPKDEENDLRINRSATDAQLEWKRQGDLVNKKKVSREDLEAFETAYNAACGCVSRGELGQAEILLKRAKDLCNASDELTEEIKRSELIPITVQQLYVLGVLGKIDQAEALAAEVDLKSISELSTQQIAQNNLLTATTKPANPYLSHRLFHSTPRLPKSDQLFDFQQALIDQNGIALELLSSKFKGVTNSTAMVISQHDSPTLSAGVNAASSANAAACAQNELGKLGLKSILPLLEKRPKDVGLVVTIVQLYMLTKNHGAAIKVMDTFFKHLDESATPADQDVRFAPGLVATLVSLYAVEGRKSHIRTELARAASYWRHKSKAPPALLHAAGLSLLESSKPEDWDAAGQTFEGLRKQDPDDTFATVGLVAAYATIDPSKVSRDADKLTPINRLTVGVDVAALEKASIPQTAQASASSILGRKRAAGADNAKPSKKRVRKSRLPKEYDPNKKADPERWLPLRDRSTYRPRGKKGKQKQAALTQGGVSEKDKAADASATEAVKTQTAGGGGGGKSKRNKKRK